MSSTAQTTIIIHALTCVLASGAVTASPYGTATAFSFWRNLVIGKQTKVTLEYPRALAPLPRQVAEQCCTIRPGQRLTLVRHGRVVDSGLVGEITAADIPSAGEFRRVFFEAVGFPDSANAGSGPPPFPDPTARIYDLFVIGDVTVEELTPAASPWGQAGSFPRAVAQAVAAGVIGPAAFADLAGASGHRRPWSPVPDSLAAILRAECELIEYLVPVCGRETLTVQSCQRRGSRFGPYFVRVSSSQMNEPVFIRGELDFFLRVDGVAYLVCRDQLPGTGAWGYDVYRLTLDAPPERVHSDGSWST